MKFGIPGNIPNSTIVSGVNIPTAKLLSGNLEVACKQARSAIYGEEEKGGEFKLCDIGYAQIVNESTWKINGGKEQLFW